MRIALSQLNIQWEEKEENQRICEEMILNAARRGADCIIFPEMTLTGFSMNVAEVAESSHQSLSMLFFKKMSRKYHIAIIFGYAEWDGELVRNKCAMVDEGRQLLSYTKRRSFIPGGEQRFYAQGSRAGMVQLDDLIFSTYICFDLRFPELFLAECKNAHVAVVIANWPADRIEQWKILLQARAVENQCYVLGVNRVGNGNGILYNGHSLAVDPYGRILNRETTREDLQFVDIDRRVVDQLRVQFPLY